MPADQITLTPKAARALILNALTGAGTTGTSPTVTSISQTKPQRSLPEILICMLAPTILLLRRRGSISRSASLLGIALLTATLLAVSGCGSGTTALRYATSGSYQFQVTASSTTGTPYTQTVNLNLTVQ